MKDKLDAESRAAIVEYLKGLRMREAVRLMGQ